MKHEVITTLDALSEAWIILDELGLASMLVPGKEITVDFIEMAQKLFNQKKLHAFIGAITGLSIAEVGSVKLAEAVELITAFFISMGNELGSLAGMVVAAKAGEQTGR